MRAQRTEPQSVPLQANAEIIRIGALSWKGCPLRRSLAARSPRTFTPPSSTTMIVDNYFVAVCPTDSEPVPSRVPSSPARCGVARTSGLRICVVTSRPTTAKQNTVVNRKRAFTVPGNNDSPRSGCTALGPGPRGCAIRFGPRCAGCVGCVVSPHLPPRLASADQPGSG